jgi:hypothetical protein
MVHLLAISNMTTTRAMVIQSRTQSDLLAGMKSMMIQNLKEKMTNGVAHFLFLKKDGSVREAWGTLNRSLVSKYINGRGESRETYSTSAYFDVEKAEWRSFRWESIIQVF